MKVGGKENTIEKHYNTQKHELETVLSFIFRQTGKHEKIGVKKYLQKVAVLP